MLRNQTGLRNLLRESTLLALFILTFIYSVHGQTVFSPRKGSAAARLSDSSVKQLPPALRARAQALVREKDEKQRASIAGNLAQTAPAASMEFLLSVLATDPSAAVRYAIINRLGRYSHLRVRRALESHAASDSDPRVAVLALDRLRGQRNSELRQLLTKRLELARRDGDEAGLKLLADEQERWISLVKGTMLPGFLRVPPPLFSVKPPDQPVRFLAFGDFGTGSEQQKKVAAAMLGFHRSEPFDFAITLGDNFYDSGMSSPNDPRWKTWWSDLYDPLGVKFYAVLGNHDWVLSDSPAAEILYSERGASWRMPSPYYTFTAGPVQLFALDTNEISEAQLMWLTDQLTKSSARWKIVYGHHPIYSAGAHNDNPSLINRLLPVLKGRADVYVAGHDHDLQHLEPEGGVHFFVAGGGGANVRQLKAGPRSLFAKDAYGFAVIEANEKQLRVKFIGTDLSRLYEYALSSTRP